MKKTELDELKNKGFTIIRNQVNEEWLNRLSVEMDNSFIEHKKIQERNNNEITSDGVALNALVGSETFLEFLEFLLKSEFIQSIENFYFESKCILNSFSALNNLPNQKNFASLIHRDLRFFSGEFPIMINCLLMIDDFTIENGGTYLLPYSHLKSDKPEDTYFYKNCVQATGNKGDILLFNSNLWHAAAPNLTNKGRKGIPITLSKSFMKQLLDYPRAIGYERKDTFSEEMQQLLGYNSRVPASLDEWYQPKENRLYKNE